MAAGSSAAFTLHRRQLFMLPTRFGVIFAIVLFVMLLAAVNYNNGLAYGFTFLLVALSMVSMLYTHRNVSGLTVRVGMPTPVFTGGSMSFPVIIENDQQVPRSAVWVLSAGSPLRMDVPPNSSVSANLPVPATERGYLRCPPLRLSSAFPLGLLYTWSAALEPEARGIAYPKLVAAAPPPAARQSERHDPAGSFPEGDDFVGLRAHQPGDPPRHVHWKAAARGQGLLTKRFGAEGQGRMWIDWEMTAGSDVEARLQTLCRWIVDAEEQGMIYGLRMPDRVLPPGRGPAHRHACLSVLALWGLDNAPA
jgi:uncharacterized protein (DUF58 family)